MDTPLALPEFAALAAWSPSVGEIIENFGQLARVLEIDPQRGILVRAMPGQGFARGRDRWYASPGRCRPAR